MQSETGTGPRGGCPCSSLSLCWWAVAVTLDPVPLTLHSRQTGRCHRLPHAPAGLVGQVQRDVLPHFGELALQDFLRLRLDDLAAVARRRPAQDQAVVYVV